ncbi:unnamed protein product, partial [Symbiodinium pilosum]
SGQTRTLRDVFSYHFRAIARLAEHFGQKALERLRGNLEYMRVCSLYSGIGGAELSISLAHAAAASRFREADQP